METQENPKSFVVVTFAAVGSVIMNVQFEGTTPMQLLALSDYLGLIGRNKLLGELAEREEQLTQQKLSVPENKIIVASK